MEIPKVDIDEQLKEITYFLGKTHPTLLNNQYNNYCIEIRPIKRGKGNFNYSMSRPLNLWRLDEKAIEHLRGFLEIHNGQPYDLFFSIFYFDYDAPTRRKGYITRESSKYTEELVFDFDNTNESDVLEFMELLHSCGLEGLWLWTVHGYHLHLLLNERCYDKEILLKAVYLLRAKGFHKVDTVVSDPARIMRLTGTYNFKLLEPNSKYSETEPLLTSIFYDTDKRFSIKEIFEKIEALPTKDDAAFETYQNTLKNIEERTEILTQSKIKYPYLDDIELPSAVNKILSNTPEGLRNSAFGFLIKFLKQYVKLSKSNIYEIMSIWSKYAASPRYDSLDDDFDRLFIINGLNYNADLSREFGPINFNEISTNDYIYIPNDVINDFDTIQGTEIRAYLAIKLLEYENNECSLVNIAEKLNLSTRALNKTLQGLCKTKHAYKTKNNRREKEVYFYNSAKIVNISKGYARFTYEETLEYLNDLNNNELKVFLFLKVKAYKTNSSHASQETLGEYLDLAQNTISLIMKNLEKKEYISIEKRKISKNISYCTYSLLK